MDSEQANKSRWWRVADRVGATASFLCAIHCALLPFVLALLPFVGLEFLADHRFERGFVLFACTLALFAMIRGYRRHPVRASHGRYGLAVDGGIARNEDNVRAGLVQRNHLLKAESPVAAGDERSPSGERKLLQHTHAPSQAQGALGRAGCRALLARRTPKEPGADRSPGNSVGPARRRMRQFWA